MFELYKKRELGDYISDTFGFFKSFGKHFFKIFFVINGAFLLITGALVYWFLRVNFQFLSQNNTADPNQVLSYFDNQYPIVIGCIVIFVLVALVLSLFNSAYPILYLKLIERNNTNDFTLEDIMTSFKQNLWKIIKFCIGMIFIVVPVLFIAIIIMFLLCFIIVGIPLILISIPAFFTWMNLSFYTYLTEDKGFFESINHAYVLLRQNFWNTIATTFIVMMMMQMIQASITMVFYFAGIFIFFVSAVSTSDFATKPFEGSPVLLAFISLIFVLIFALSYIFNNALMVNQGIIYYSLGADDKTSNREIELIGSDNE
ncbi:hypothetical protein [Flavobacterium chilense]|uniref:Membrane domain of glycerophosphoryl diester phosphodiesterase n=1 Tax=Flavobacterium chilense TaxID=946677 RepID=A0A1M6XXU8_9FLAO|nr:hypothetical protein [Flavobacterium chilense]SHL10807.1 hypothetical protein SAMN05444484_101330 [Flavobacterium chilense]